MESCSNLYNNQILSTLGVFILWLDGSDLMVSQLAWGGDDAVAASAVAVVTNLAAAAGALGALITTGFGMENQT